MNLEIQDASCKSQENRNTGNTMEGLVPDFELCEKIPTGKFQDSALVWDYKIGRWTNQFRVRKRELFDTPICPAPTLAEIIEAIKTKTYCKDDLCDHKYDLHYCAIDLKWIFCFGENFAVADTLSSAALKLWLELNSKKEVNR